MRFEHVLSIATVCLAVGCKSRESVPSGSGTQTANVTVETKIQPVQFPAPATIDTGTRARLPKDEQAKIPTSTVPVLVPKDDALLAVSTLMIEDVWTAFHAQANDITVHVAGTRLAHEHPEIPPSPGQIPIRSGKGRVTVNEGIRQATFEENGVSYAVDVECAKHDDTRCATDAFVIELTNGLVYVGGGGS